MGHLGRGKNALEDRESILRLVWCDRGPSTRSEKKTYRKERVNFCARKKTIRLEVTDAIQHICTGLQELSREIEQSEIYPLEVTEGSEVQT